MSQTTSRHARGIALAIVAIATLLFVQCGKSTPASPTPTPAAPTVTSVALTVNTAALFKRGATAQMTATGTMSSGGTQDVTAQCTGWLSDNTAVATISSSGLVTAQGSGATTFVATCSNAAARLLTALTVAIKSTPSVTMTSMNLGVSKDPPYLPFVVIKLIYSESGKAFGYNVNFTNFQVRTSSGSTLSSPNFGPDVFKNGSAPGYKAGDAYIWPAWGTNHIDPAGSKFACFVSASFTPMPNSVTVTLATQVTDDVGIVIDYSTTNSVTPRTDQWSCDETNGIDSPSFRAPMPSPSGTGRSF
jgi:hypothetical protein